MLVAPRVSPVSAVCLLSSVPARGGGHQLTQPTQLTSLFLGVCFQSLHWVADINQVGSSGALASLGPRPSGDDLAWAQASRIAASVTTYLSHCLRPLLDPGLGQGAGRRGGGGPGGAGGGEAEEEAERVVARVVARMSPLSVALADVGVVQVSMAPEGS